APSSRAEFELRTRASRSPLPLRLAGSTNVFACLWRCVACKTVLSHHGGSNGSFRGFSPHTHYHKPPFPVRRPPSPFSCRPPRLPPQGRHRPTPRRPGPRPGRPPRPRLSPPYPLHPRLRLRPLRRRRRCLPPGRLHPFLPRHQSRHLYVPRRPLLSRLPTVAVPRRLLLRQERRPPAQPLHLFRRPTGVCGDGGPRQRGAGARARHETRARRRYLRRHRRRGHVCQVRGGLVDNRRYDETVSFFREIYGEESVNPDQVSFSSVLCACASNGGLVFGKQVHACAIKLGVDSLAYVNNSLIDMYGKCGSFIESRLLFGCASHKDVVTWNVIAMGWTQNDQFEEACTCFWAMRREGIHPDEASFSTALYASAGLAALDQGASVHSQIVKTGFVKNPCVGSSLITMYAKCGDLEHALRVFQEMEGSRSVVSWTAMIKACQQHGRGNQVIDLFEKMLGEGLEPDYITYVCILSACSHNGLVDRGFQYFNSMSEVHGIDPGYEHYACMVDMLGRAGRLVEARALINKMPIAPDASIWGALLGACRNYGSLDMGKEAAYKLFEMEPHNSGNYVLLCSMYVRHGKFKEAEEVRRLMGLNRVRKETSCSWIDVKNRTHVFTVHDRSHHRSNEIYNMLGLLEDLVKKKGYVAELQYAIDGVEEHKEHDLWYHSERLALAFGLISLPASAPIRIKKNIRTCLDCHMVMKLVSDILKREIILRDTNRFHQFTNGSCSCGDYW
ncbi:hypothetical protein Taro_019244, partial [Colocasia esculenta]|nr:hypothetical protein [Colocasia esculenta]